MSLTVAAPPRRSFWPASALGTNIALVFLGSMLLGLSHHLTLEFDDFIIGYSETSLCALVVFLGAALLVARQPVNRWTLPILCVFAVLCRLVLLVPDPHLSSDIYRYVWDGIMQHHGINPYHYVPGDPHLTSLRDDTIFPSINRRDYAPTIYPPFAQMFFYATTAINYSLTAMKLGMYAAEAVTVYALVRMLQALHLRREMVILYMWSPLVIWEIGSSGHVDALLTMCVALALWARLKDKPVLTGLALGAAVLTKFYPLLLFPALYRRRDWKMPATLTAFIVLGYLPYLSVGRRVFGFASGYVQEEGIETGTRYFLLALAQHVHGLANLPSSAFIVFCGLCFLPILLWCWHRNRQPGAAFVAPAAALAFALMLLFSPHYPWYVIWLIPFVVIEPSLPMGVYLCALWYGLTTQWSEPGAKFFFLSKWIYGATAVAFLLQWIYGRWLHRYLPLGTIFPRTEEERV